MSEHQDPEWPVVNYSTLDGFPRVGRLLVMLRPTKWKIRALDGSHKVTYVQWSSSIDEWVEVEDPSAGYGRVDQVGSLVDYSDTFRVVSTGEAR